MSKRALSLPIELDPMAAATIRAFIDRAKAEFGDDAPIVISAFLGKDFSFQLYAETPSPKEARL